MPSDLDVIVVGAGAAGLTAATELAKAGLAVTILEARDRMGGRMFTLRDKQCDAPVEMGAEFIHGRPPQIWKLLKSRRIRIREVNGDAWCVRNEQLRRCNFFSDVDNILEQMSDREPDRSFSQFLADCCRNLKPGPRLEEARQRATDYVSGFNAADPDEVGVHWLVKGMRAEERIQGHRVFRSRNGYADLLEILGKRAVDAGVRLRLNNVVDRIRWRSGNVTVGIRDSKNAQSLQSAFALITVPLGVLQAKPGLAGAIGFTPELPATTRRAIQNIAMGKVIRVTLRFREPFWESQPQRRTTRKSRRTPHDTMRDISFLFSSDTRFPTWWTNFPERWPLITGWAPFRFAEKLSGHSESSVAERGLRSLSTTLGLELRELENMFEQAYCHDWQNDPFSRGAYSYGKAGAVHAPLVLSQPVDNTLFFAGEAADTGGQNGTVHGAIASGQNAAAKILKAAGRSLGKHR